MSLRVAWLLVLASALALPSCSRPGDPPGKKILHLALSEDPRTLDPAVSNDENSDLVIAQTDEALYNYVYLKSPPVLEPQLAEAMPKVSPDGRTYTIRIRRGIRFQDDPAFPGGRGRELQARDFIYAWKRLFKPSLNAGGKWLFEGRIVGMDRLEETLAHAPADKVDELLAEPVEGMMALDDYTLRIRLVRKCPQLAQFLAMMPTVPVPREAVARYGESGMSWHLVGTGPFVLARLVRGSEIEFRKNLNFRDERYPSDGSTRNQSAARPRLPFVDGIDFRIIKEAQPAWMSFLKGRLDLNGIPKDSFDSVITAGALVPEIQRQGIILHRVPEPTLVWLNFNMKDPLLGSSRLLRGAISRAINREKWIELFLNGRGAKATSIVPPMIAGSTGRRELIGDYDPAAARRLLAQAGYPGGKGLPPIRFDLGSTNSASRQMAEFVVRSLAAIGIQAEIDATSLPAFMMKLLNGNLQLFMGGWQADYPDAENFLQLAYSRNFPPGSNQSRWSNPEYDRLYERISEMEPSPERGRLISQAEEILLADAGWALLYYPTAYLLQQPWVKHYWPYNQRTHGIYRYLDIDLAQKQRALSRL